MESQMLVVPSCAQMHNHW